VPEDVKRVLIEFAVSWALHDLKVAHVPPLIDQQPQNDSSLRPNDPITHCI